MPNAKATSVAAPSHGISRLAKPRKRVGLAKSIRAMSVHSVLSLGAELSRARGIGYRCVYTMIGLSFHPVPKRRGGRERAEHNAHERERTQDRERGAKRDRSD